MKRYERKPFYKVIGLLKSENLTQQTLANELGITYQSLNGKLHGRYKLSYDQAKQIAARLNITLNEFE